LPAPQAGPRENGRPPLSRPAPTAAGARPAEPGRPESGLLHDAPRPRHTGRDIAFCIRSATLPAVCEVSAVRC